MSTLRRRLMIQQGEGSEWDYVLTPDSTGKIPGINVDVVAGQTVIMALKLDESIGQGAYKMVADLRQCGGLYYVQNATTVGSGSVPSEGELTFTIPSAGYISFSKYATEDLTNTTHSCVGTYIKIKII